MEISIGTSRNGDDSVEIVFFNIIIIKLNNPYEILYMLIWWSLINYLIIMFLTTLNGHLIFKLINLSYSDD